MKEQPWDRVLSILLARSGPACSWTTASRTRAEPGGQVVPPQRPRHAVRVQRDGEEPWHVPHAHRPGTPTRARQRWRSCSLAASSSIGFADTSYRLYAPGWGSRSPGPWSTSCTTYGRGGNRRRCCCPGSTARAPKHE
jgi:hypothetical protein